jgi:transketolase
MAAVTDTGTIQFSRTAADTRTVFNSRTVTNSGAITRAVTNAAAVGTGLAASGPAEQLYEYFGITVDEVVDSVKNLIKK